MSTARKISHYLGRWPLALLAIVVMAAVLLLPALGKPGLWEPSERVLADRIAPPDPVQVQLDVQKRKLEEQRAQQQRPKPPEPACRKAPPEDALARSLSHRAIRFGRDYVADSDGGRKLPLALFGFLTVLATAGIAMRLGGARAGLVAGVVVLSMPLLVLQSRMLTSDIGTACGASLVVYGLVSLHWPPPVSPLRGLGSRLAMYVVGVLALAAGIVIGFLAGGALLGLLVPLGAVAAAGKLGIPFVIDTGKAAYNTALAIGQRRQARWSIGRTRLAYHGGNYAAAFVATLAVIALVAALAYQLYELSPPHPGITPPVRRIGNVAIVPEACWSWLLGGVWRAEDDLRFVFDSSFEQIAYGTYPWGLLAPVAMLLLVRDDDPARRWAGALTLAWAGAAWIAAETFHRKVGVSIWAGFPALAVAIGVWLDGVLARRARGDGSVVPAAAMLIGLFLFFGVVDLGKDLIAFPEKLTSLLTGAEVVQYPPNARLLGLKVKHLVALVGVATILGAAAALVLWRPGTTRMASQLRRIALVAAAVSLGASILLSAFWAFAWHPRLADHLSSKAMFETYRELRKPGDHLVIMGDLGHAPFFYAGTAPRAPGDPGWDKAANREQVVTALKRPERVFAIAPQGELCAMHRELGDKPYFVIDDRNTRNLLFSNRVDGAEDKNPLRNMIVHEPPKQISHRPKGRVVWDNRIELLGWDIPKRVRRGQRFDVTLYYKILQPIVGNWTVIMHFDGTLRFSGDHKPIQDRCPTSTWQPGDYIIDRTTVVAGGPGHPLGHYALWIGFFTGTAPNFKNMDLSIAPSDMRDTTHRVKITTVILD